MILIFVFLLVSFAEAAADSSEELRFQELDYKIKQWQQLSQSNLKVVVPEGFLEDIEERELLAVKLLESKVAESKKNSEIEVVAETTKSLGTILNQVTQVDKLLSANEENLRDQQEILLAWKKKYRDEKELYRQSKKGKGWDDAHREKLVSFEKDVDRKLENIENKIGSIKRKQDSLAKRKMALATSLAAAGIIDDVQKGDFLNSSQEVIDLGKQFADSDAYERLNIVSSGLGTAGKAAEGDWLGAVKDTLNSIDDLYPDYSDSITNEKEFIEILASSSFGDPKLKKAADLYRAKSAAKVKKMEEVQARKKNIQAARNKLDQVEKAVEYIQLARAVVATMQGKYVDVSPGTSLATARLISGMKFSGEQIKVLVDKLPPGFKESIGAILEFYADVLIAGPDIYNRVRDMYKNRDCDNQYRWTASHVKRVFNDQFPGICVKPTFEFKENASLYVNDDPEGYPPYIFIPSMEQDPQLLSRDTYSEIARIASAYTVYATVFDESFEVNDEVVAAILKAVENGSPSFTIDGWISSREVIIATLESDADMLLEIRSALGSELTPDNAREMITAWKSYLDDIHHTERVCGIDMFKSSEVRQRLFVSYLKDRDGFYQFLGRQKLFGDQESPTCKMKFLISGTEKTKVGQAVELHLQPKPDSADVHEGFQNADIVWYENDRRIGSGAVFDYVPKDDGKKYITAEIAMQTPLGARRFKSSTFVMQVTENQAGKEDQQKQDTVRQMPEKTEDEGSTGDIADSGLPEKSDADKGNPKTTTAPAEKLPDSQPSDAAAGEEKKNAAVKIPSAIPANPAESVKRASPAKIKKVPGVKNAGSVMYGSTLQLNLGENYETGNSGSVEETNRKFDELSAKAAENFKNSQNNTKLPARRVEIDESLSGKEAVVIDGENGNSKGTISAVDPDIIKEPDLPTGIPTDCQQEESDCYDTHLHCMDDADPDYIWGSYDECMRFYFMQYRGTATGKVTTQKESVPVQEELEAEKSQKPKYKFVFQSSPTLTFNPPESSTGKTSVVIDRLDEIKIWAEVHNISDPDAESEKTDQYVYQVKKPAFSLTNSPATVLLGQEVQATVTAKPSVPAHLVQYVWLSPQSKREYTANGSQIGFIPEVPGPFELTVEARVPGYGDVLGTASSVLAASTYTVTITPPKRSGPPPRVWDEKRKQLVEVPRGILVHQIVEVGAIISPKPEADLRYKWKVHPDGCVLTAPYSSTTRVTASRKGTYALTLVVTSKDGIELGEGSTSFTVTTMQEEVVKGEKHAEDYRKSEELLISAKQDWQNKKHLPAIEKIKKVLEYNPDQNEAKNLLVQWQKVYEADEKKYAAYVREGYEKKDTEEFAVAIKAFEAAQAMRYNSDIEVMVNELKRIVEQQKIDGQKFNEILQQAYSIEKKGDLKGAIDKYQSALQIKPDAKVKSHIDELWQLYNEKQAVAQKFDDLLKKGYAEEKAGNAQKAISLYKQAAEVKSDPNVEKRIRELEEKQGKRKKEDEKKKEFAELIQQGFAAENENNHAKAIELLKKALEIHNDPTVARRVSDLEKQYIDLKKQKKKKGGTEEEFAALLKKGYDREKKSDLQGAVNSYKKALQIRNDKKVRERVENLQKEINANRKIAEQKKKKLNEKQQAKKSQPDAAVQPATVTWTGTYLWSQTDGEQTFNMSMQLRQNGSNLTGEVEMDQLGTFPARGSCNGNKGTLVVGDGTLQLEMAADGRSIRTVIEENNIELRKIN